MAVREAYIQIDAGLVDALSFWGGFEESFSDYCIGATGVDPDLREIWEDSCKAWWLADIAAQALPTPCHEQKFLSLYTRCRPALEALQWPWPEFNITPPMQFWPPAECMLSQYRKWWAHAHATSREKAYQEAWLPVVRWLVQPATPRWIAWHRWFFQALTSAACKAGASIAAGSITELTCNIASFLSPERGLFNVELKNITIITRKRQSRGCHSHGAQGDFKVGDFARCRRGIFRGQCIQMVKAISRCDQVTMAAHFEEGSRFAQGCWHVQRMFLRCRRLGSTESPCENWVGQLKYLYRPEIGPQVASLVQRARLRIAGVRCNGGDDAFVREVANMLHCTGGRKSRWLQKHQQEIKTQASDTTAVAATAEAVTTAKVIAAEKVAGAASGAFGTSRETRKSVASQNRTFWTPRQLEVSDIDLLEHLEKTTWPCPCKLTHGNSGALT